MEACLGFILLASFEENIEQCFSSASDVCVVNFSVPWCVALSFGAAVCLQPCCQHPPESRAAPTPTSFTLEIDGDSNTVRSVAKQRGSQFVSKVSAYLSFASLLPPLCLRFSFKKKISLPRFL